jgi:phospholipid-binding lipoprotein MlaA
MHGFSIECRARIAQLLSKISGIFWMTVRTIVFAAVISLSACASEPSGEIRPIASDTDPYEGFNRQMFAFNAGVDKYAAAPAAAAFKTATPKVGRDRLGDFLDNLGEPVTFANDVLQAKPGRAGATVARFGINTTLGIVGFWNAAGEFGIERHEEDFGQTLAVWGVGSGPFIVLPLLGPTTPRDLVGRGVDSALDPLSTAEFDGQPRLNDQIQLGRNVLGGLNARVLIAPQIDALNAQPEPYVALRRIYNANSEAAINDGAVNEAEIYDDLPDFDEIEP